MTPDRHARIKEIFLAACALPEEARAEFVQRSCGDDDSLRADVEQLLKHHTEDRQFADGFAEKTRQVSGPPGVGTPFSASAESARSASTAGAGEEDGRDFTSGTIVAGRYRIVSLLGRGGMGEVYRADDLVLGQAVALKFLPASLARDPGRLERMLNEVRLARQVTHPHVCRVHDISKADDDYFITMEYVDGEDLKSLLNRIGRLASDKALDIARQLCGGLAAAHARGLLHRDLKPANVMLDGRGRAVITDFGLAGAPQDIKGMEIRAGTPAYMAPEQLAGREVTVRSDIYALGLILYELFTGKPAFSARTVADYARLKESSTASPPSSIVSDIDPVVERVILRCLENRPDDRPPSVMAVAAALPGGDPLAAALAAGEIPSPELVAAAGETRRMRLPLALTGLAGFFLMLCVAVFLSAADHPVRQAGLDKMPQVLADKARELARELAPDVRILDEDYGFREEASCVFARSPNGADATVSFALARPDKPPVVFWYRASPSYLLPSDPQSLVFGSARVTPSDPPPTEGGMISLTLDGNGRLLGLEVTPERLTASSRPAQAADWAGLLMKAGLNPATLTPVEPQIVPRVFADARVAWRGPDPNDNAREIRVEGATCDGRPVFLAVLSVRPASGGLPLYADVDIRQAVIDGVRTLLLTVLVIVSVPLARLNTHLGRGDRRGAFRLASFVFVIRMLVWLLQATHIPSLIAEWRLLTLAITGALAEAALVWLFYVALELYVRRFWPQTLISWSRLLSGAFRDSLVGRNILFGALLGVFWVVLKQLDVTLTPLLGLTPRRALLPDDFFAALLGARQGFAFSLDTLRNAVYQSLILMLLLILLRAVLKRPVIAGVAGFLLVSPLVVPQGSHPLVSWPLLGIGGLTVAVWTFARFGLVPIITALFVSATLLRFPLTLELQAWYADFSAFAMLLTVGIAVYGFVTALREKPVVRGLAA